MFGENGNDNEQPDVSEPENLTLETTGREFHLAFHETFNEVLLLMIFI